MARVTGIGGFFFRSPDPDALNRWYAEHLGVVMIESRTYDEPGWFQERGETVFAACWWTPRCSVRSRNPG